MPTIKPKFKIEKIDEKTARKIDTMESISTVDIDGLRKQSTELSDQIAKLAKMKAEMDEVISEFDKLP